MRISDWSSDVCSSDLNDELAAIRRAVRTLCADFPGEYWRDLDRKAEYPTAFVKSLTEAGFLAALDPEAYGGSGLNLAAAAVIMEAIQASGRTEEPTSELQSLMRTSYAVYRLK